MAVPKSKTDRPRHLQVIGTRINDKGFAPEFHRLLAEVPIEWNFDNPAGDALLEYIHKQVEEGSDIDALAKSIDMEPLAGVYRDWVKDHG